MKSVNIGAIEHMPWLEDRHALPDGRVCLRVRAGRGDFDRVSAKISSNYDGPEFFEKARVAPMERVARDERFDWYQAVFAPRDRRLKYLFVLEGEGGTFKLDGAGLHPGADWPEDVDQAFAFAYAWPAPDMPQWAKGCVGYEIFPDRFRREGPEEPGLEPWTSDRVQNEIRFGGNLRGVLEAVPYLKELGVEVVYTMPLFVSDTSHRYNTFDYYAIDPLLGTEEDLRALADTLHRRGMRLMMDGVFNHVGLGFPPFQDALEKGEASPYRDWFLFDDTEEWGYQTFGHWRYMPKLNLKNPDCAAYFCDVGRYWLKNTPIDGWRLDVSPEVWPDFWRQYRRMMKEANPDSLMVAECWDDSREWLSVGDMFDSTMNYLWSRSVWDRFCTRKISPEAFDGAMNRLAVLYPDRVHQVLWNFLDTHDTPRIRTRAGGDARRQRAASFFQFTYPGSPILYYGDELGMEGGGDPYCRFPMRWNDVENNPMLAHYQTLARLRRENPALRLGGFRTWKVLDNGLYAYLRVLDDQTMLCVLNTGDERAEALLPLPEALAKRDGLMDLYAGKVFSVDQGGIYAALEAGEGLIFA